MNILSARLTSQVAPPGSHVPIGRTLVNLGHVVGGEAALRIANFVAAVVIARNCGSVVFGTYATTLAYVTIATMLADNGLQVSAVKEIASRPHELDVITSRLFVAKSMLLLLMLPILGFIGWGAHLSYAEWAIAGLITARTLLQSYCQLQIAILKAIDRLQWLSPIQSSHSLILLAGLSCLYFWKAEIVGVLLLLVSGQVLELLAESVWLARIGIRPARVRLRDCLRLIHGSTTTGVTLSVQNITQRLDVIVVSWLAGAAAAGVFAAAQMGIVIASVVASLFGSVLFPDMVRLAAMKGDLQQYTRRWIVLSESLLIPATLLGMLVLPGALRVLFGTKFHDSGHILLLMMPAVPFMFLNSILLARAFAMQQTRFSLGLYSTVAVVSVAANGFLVSAFGPAAVAITLIAREVVATTMFGRVNRRMELVAAARAR